jgi:hypothetical protein
MLSASTLAKEAKGEVLHSYRVNEDNQQNKWNKCFQRDIHVLFEPATFEAVASFFQRLVEISTLPAMNNENTNE